MERIRDGLTVTVKWKNKGWDDGNLRYRTLCKYTTKKRKWNRGIKNLPGQRYEYFLLLKSRPTYQ